MYLQTSCLVIILGIGMVVCEGTICYLSSCSFDSGMKWILPKVEAALCTEVILGGHSLTCPEEGNVLFFKTALVFSHHDDPRRFLNTTGSDIWLCPKNMEYGKCSCQATCEDPTNDNGCNNVCTEEETCVCSDGFLMKGGECVREENCGCFLEEAGVLKNDGIYINSNCTRNCSCHRNQVICEDIQCSADATCREIEGKHQCECDEGFVGDGQDCALAATDCLDLYNFGVTTDGVYTIHPTGWSRSGFEVYCEMGSNGGGWTVFQRRVNGTVDFFLDWASYKEGFGTLTHEFWLGNDKIHTLTHQRNYQLRMDVVTSHNTSIYSLFNSFSISDENDKYRLTVKDNSGNTVGNPLNHNNGQRFSTYDQDNDATSRYSCAEEHRGSWWYGYYSHNFQHHNLYCWKWHIGNKYEYCSDSNLNGDYYKSGPHGNFLWYSNDERQFACGLTRTEMKIRHV